MSDSYDLSALDANSFEHLINMLALRVLGLGHTGFGPGSDGGRDGYFEGEAPYPSDVDHWSGVWYIQSKFHKPHLSKDPQKWLIEQIQEELNKFQNSESKRKWPNNWIVATNVDPSGAAETGAFDRARDLVQKARPSLRERFHIWGGRKVLDLLAFYPEVSDYYKHFLTPGHILTLLHDEIKDARADSNAILRHLIVTQLSEQQHTKLEQAGSASDNRPGIHRLFIDLPFRANEHKIEGMVLEYLSRTLAKCHRIEDDCPETEAWRIWRKHPVRAKSWFIKGGPGQGKSTIGQYLCQIQRAALINVKAISRVPRPEQDLATEIRDVAEKMGFWPTIPRIPLSVELKEFAQWFGERDKNLPRGVLTYLAERITKGVEQPVSVGHLKRLLGLFNWLVVFDGLDEVPDDTKEEVASEVRLFIDNIAVEINADIFTICTSRPQGYSGQFNSLDAPTIELVNLNQEQALKCAKPILELGRSANEARISSEILSSAIDSHSVRELMTTPLQSHIMAVVVRDGGRPPERRWQLFTKFYQVIKKREADRNLPDRRLAKLLREDDKLLKTVHNRLGFVLHARAETSKGALTTLSRVEFEELVKEAVSQLMDEDVNITVTTLMNATINRLVLVSTPDDGGHVRFDIRPLQEFFAAEFLYEFVGAKELSQRLEIVAGDAHWREAIHFLMSALIENDRRTELTVAVEILENLNESEEETASRILKRRLARGALVSLRLLQEGVLEQDKRIRQQFRNCLEAITSSTERGLLQGFTLVKQPQSRSWLINFLLNMVHEVRTNESIGASVGLFNILNDDDEKTSNFASFLLSSPPDYLSFVLSTSVPRIFSAQEKPIYADKRWLVEFVLALCLRSDWFIITPSALESCLEILRANRNIAMTHIKTRKLNSYSLNLFRIALDRNGISTKTKDVDYGFVRITVRSDEVEENRYLRHIDENKIVDAPTESPGILLLYHYAATFAKHQEKQQLVQLLEYLRQVGVQVLDVLPFALRSIIPIKTELSLPEQITYLSSISDTDLQKIILHQAIEIRPHRLRLPSSHNQLTEELYNLWKKFVHEYLQIAIYIWGTSNTAENTFIIRDDKIATNIMVDKILEEPSVLPSFVPLWGDLLHVADEYLEVLRNKLLDVARQPVTEAMWPGRLSTFCLDLPKESSLLPHIVSGLTLDYNRHYYRPYNEPDRMRERLNRFSQQFVGNPNDLLQILQSEELPSIVRSSSALLYVLHTCNVKDIDRIRIQLVDTYKEKPEIWLLRSIMTTLDVVSSEKDQSTRWIVGQLLEHSRSDFERSQIIAGLLSNWRERSHAPVQTAEVQEMWLSQQ